MRTLRTLLACTVAAVALAACGGDGDDRRSAVELLESVDGVAAVEPVLWTDEAEETYLRVVLEDDLPEEQVRSAVDDVKSAFDEEGAPDPGSLEVAFDGFRAGVYPRHTGIENPDPDFERALWLREDGRATAFGPGPHFRPGGRLAQYGVGTLALAPPAEVFQLALDLESAVGTANEVRRSYAVGSPDGSVRVQWSNYPGSLDRSGLATLVAVQERYPGTTGWYDDSTPDAGVHFDDDELTLAQTIARGPALLEGLRYTEVGWGPLRAQTFPELGRRARELGPALDRLRAMDGVRAVTDEGVQVEDLATLDAVRRLLPDETVQLVREPNDLIGFAPDPVLEVGYGTTPGLLRFWRRVVAIDGVRQVNPSLVVESDITDSDLGRLLALVRSRLRPGESLDVFVGEAPIYRVSEGWSAGVLAGDGTFTPSRDPQPPVTDELVDRVADAWAAAPAG